MATLYLTEQYSTVKKDGECLVVQLPAEERGGERRNVTVPLLKVDQVVVVGNITLTTPALLALLEQEVEVCWLSYYGHFRGRLHPALSKNAPLRLAQHTAHRDTQIRGEIARQIVIGKLKNMRAVLLRYARSREDAEIAFRAAEIGGYIGKASVLSIGGVRNGEREERKAMADAKKVFVTPSASILEIMEKEEKGVSLREYGNALTVPISSVEEADWQGGAIKQEGVDTYISEEEDLGGGSSQVEGIESASDEIGEEYKLDAALLDTHAGGKAAGGKNSDVREAGREVEGRMHGLGALLGLEGAGSAAYFSVFGKLLKPEWGEMFHGRVRRPPSDPVNSLLSFGYTLLSSQAMSVSSVVGFDPYVGYLHASGYGKPALALDLIEEFRPIVVDSVVITLLNTGVLKATDFVWEGSPAGEVSKGGSVRLTDAGRKVFLTKFEERLLDTIKHPVFGYRATYRRCMEMQARLLAKTVTGEISGYVPFVVR